MALLFFLASVIKRKKNRTKAYVDLFFLKIVDNLNLCKTFPWGTLTFDDCLKNLSAMMDKFKGKVNNSWTFSCFITPLEIFPYEAIPKLKRAFLVDVDKPKSARPRMCKKEFAKTGEKGYPLQKIYDEIGAEKDFESILLPEVDEQHLVPHVTKPLTCHPTIKRWKYVLLEKKGSIFWENLYQRDKLNRVVEQKDKCGTRKTVNSETNVVGKDDLRRKVCLLETTVQSLRTELDALAAPRHEDEQQHQVSSFPDGGLNESTHGDNSTNAHSSEKEQPSPSAHKNIIAMEFEK